MGKQKHYKDSHYKNKKINQTEKNPIELLKKVFCSDNILSSIYYRDIFCNNFHEFYKFYENKKI